MHIFLNHRTSDTLRKGEFCFVSKLRHYNHSPQLSAKSRKVKAELICTNRSQAVFIPYWDLKKLLRLLLLMEDNN